MARKVSNPGTIAATKKAKSSQKGANARNAPKTPRQADKKAERGNSANSGKIANNLSIQSTSLKPRKIIGAEYHDMVETAAYYIAEKKNFQPGLDLENWLEAERQMQSNFH